MRASFAIVVVLTLAGCGGDGVFAAKPSGGGPAADSGETRPVSRPAGTAAPRPPASARTAEQFDTTSPEERKAAAAAPQPAGERLLGDTVASLGDPSRPGFWLETPLVSAPAKGRVVFPGSGKSAQVDLIPIDGPKTAGSRISLAAMRLIEAPLTDLPTVRVFQGG